MIVLAVSTIKYLDTLSNLTYMNFFMDTLFSTFFLYKTQPLLVIIQLMYVKKIQHGQDLMIHGNEKKNCFFNDRLSFLDIIFFIPF